MQSDKERGIKGGGVGDPSHDSAKRQGDKLGAAVGGSEDEGGMRGPEGEAGDPAHDSPKRHGDKLEHARDEAAGRNKR